MTPVITENTTSPAVPTVPVDLIDVLDDNHRDRLDEAHVAALAGSIRLRGITTPIKLRALDNGRYALIAGHHRLAAAHKLGLTEVPCSLQTNADRHAAEAATENVLRKQLNPVEEARAVARLIDEGCTYHAAAQILGWLRRHGDEQVPDTRMVKARLRILDLPTKAQQLVATGRLRLTAVPRVLDFRAIAPELLDEFLDAIYDGKLAAQDLYDPDWTGRRRIAKLLAERDNRGPYAAIFRALDEDIVRALKLGKRSNDAWQQAEKLNTKVCGDVYYVQPLTIRFTDVEHDQARAVGALLTLGDSDTHPGLSIILDRALYRDLARQAINRHIEELTAQQQAQAAERAERNASRRRPRTALELVEQEHRTRQREFDRQAHGVNLDLWSSLRQGLEQVDPNDLNVARFFAYGLLGNGSSSPYSPRESLVHQLAATGIRLVVPEQRTEVTPILRSGRPGRTKIAYGDVDDAIAYLWRYIDGARTAGELYGRVLVVFAAQHYARQSVLPKARRRPSCIPASRNAIARQALERLATKHLAASYRALERAINLAAREHSAQIAALQQAADAARNNDSEAKAA